MRSGEIYGNGEFTDQGGQETASDITQPLTISELREYIFRTYPVGSVRPGTAVTFQINPVPEGKEFTDFQTWLDKRGAYAERNRKRREVTIYMGVSEVKSLTR